jgi:hypothetical protein
MILPHERRSRPINQHLITISGQENASLNVLVNESPILKSRFPLASRGEKGQAAHVRKMPLMNEHITAVHITAVLLPDGGAIMIDCSGAAGRDKNQAQRIMAHRHGLQAQHPEVMS